ncbi:translation initiation factor IF-2 [Streptomyces sp. P1-3]|uniref:translation initiation factor IF-2 n=1 Tax=Streptomyces sp. P1-3 TaxID=3421658 RepID=UPI003D36F1F4
MTKGLVWLVLRQHRVVLWAGAVLVLVAAVYMTWQRADMVAYINAHDIVRCRGTARAACWSDEEGFRPNTVYAFERKYAGPLRNGARVCVAVPALIGVFVGSPLFARELESGTHRLVWSQSVSRTRWLAVKLGVATGITLAAAGAMAALYTWWWAPAHAVSTRAHDVMGPAELPWFNSVPYNAIGPVAVAWALLALMTGAAAGLLLRRTLPAMAVTLAATVGAQFGLRALRPDLVDWESGFEPIGSVATTMQLGYAWEGRWDWITDSGRIQPSGVCTDVDWDACMARHHVIGQLHDFHPPSHFWPMQWAEAGICLAAAAALAAFCLWWIRRAPAV